MPSGYLLVLYWTVVALGGALFLGTGAALVRYVRTGSFPGQSAEQETGRPATALRRAVLRCGVGFAVAFAGIAGVVSVGG